MDDHDLDTSSLNIIEQLLKGWAFRNLLPTSTSLVIFIKVWCRKATHLCAIGNRSLLSIDTIVILLHHAGTTYIASDNSRRGIKRTTLRHRVFLLSPVHLFANGGKAFSSL